MCCTFSLYHVHSLDFILNEFFELHLQDLCMCVAHIFVLDRTKPDLE